MQFLGRRAVRRGLAGGLGAVLLLAAAGASAQVNRRDVPIVAQPQQRFNSGQDIQPIFEGWTRNEDGSYQFHYGYLNRNYRERPNVPVGENNFFSPGEPDRGQPTYFYPRTNRYQFDVHVPADFPRDAELVWEVTRQGSTQRAYGWLQPEWEIDANTITSNARTQFGRSVDELYSNIPPVVVLEASHDTVAVGAPVTLIARVSDDDLPTPLPERDDNAVPRRRRDPTLVPPPGAPQIPDNIPSYTRPSPTRNHISVLWAVYRGPADAEFEPYGYQEWEEGMDGDGWTSGTLQTAVTFDEPGDYMLRAFVSDAMLISHAEIEITVTAAEQ